MKQKLTVIDRANKYAEIVMRYYRQHDPKAKATKVAYEEYKQGYISGWRAAMKQRDQQAAAAKKQLARIRQWATKGKSAVLLPEEFDQIAGGEWHK